MFSCRTINYAAPPPSSFWAWSPEYDAVEWWNGSTITMWQELHGVLKFLGDDSGLPPLGAVLLLLAACRNDWLVTCIEFHEKVMAILGVTSSDEIQVELKDTLVSGLKTVNDLPEDLRSSFPAKCLLVSALFEGGPYSLSRDESKKILVELAIHGPSGLRDSLPQMNAKARFFRDLRALRSGLARHDAASLEARLRTGLEDCEIQAPPLDDTPGSAPRHLLDRLLISGGECGAAAAVAKRTIAMMNFPGSFRTQDGLPVGGISDITNSGTLDRLLPGELAADDLILAVRLVHNEALYFRREIPPQDLTVGHTVLLDRGLRLWGTTRVVALGVALGLRHHPALNPPGATFECFAAAAEGFDILDLTTTAGVYSALEALVPAANPDIFLTEWFESVSALDEDIVPDVSLITSKAHLLIASTLELLGKIANWIHGKAGSFRVVVLGREGGFEVMSWSPSGTRGLFSGHVDLDKVFQKAPNSQKESKVPPLRIKTGDPLYDLLPIYALERFPFLFPEIPQGSAILPLDDSLDSPVIGVTNSRRLMRWPKIGWGGQELVPEVPGRQHWMGRNGLGEVMVIASGRIAGDTVCVFKVVQDILVGISVCDSKHAFPRSASVSGGAVLLIYSDCVEALSLTSGNRVAELAIEKMPANALFHFDGEIIRMIESGKKVALPLKKWPFGDSSWPRLFVPDAVAVVSGILHVTSGEDTFAFSPVSMSWNKTNRGSSRFFTFEERKFTPDSVTILRIARLRAWMEIWLDPRGVLHLRQPENPKATWSILLSTTKASVWHADWGLCATEPRLRFPDVKIHHSSVVSSLRDFLTNSTSS